MSSIKNVDGDVVDADVLDVRGVSGSGEADEAKEVDPELVDGETGVSINECRYLFDMEVGRYALSILNRSHEDFKPGRRIGYVKYPLSEFEDFFKVWNDKCKEKMLRRIFRVILETSGYSNEEKSMALLYLLQYSFYEPTDDVCLELCDLAFEKLGKDFANYIFESRKGLNSPAKVLEEYSGAWGVALVTKARAIKESTLK